MFQFRCGLLLSLLIIASPNLSAQDSGTWKINLKNADIREFTTQVSAITGKSFIIDPRVKAPNVTVISNIEMDKDAIYELYLSVLRVHGYAAVTSGGVIKIIQQVLAKQSGNPLDFDSAIRGEELVTQVIPVRNSPSTELVKILRPMVPQYAVIAPLSQPNVLIVSDHASNIARLAEIVAKIDIADPTNIKIVPLKEAWVEDMVALLEKLAPEQIGKGAKGPNRVTIVASERTNSLVIKAEPQTMSRIESLINDLDVPANRAGTIQVVRLAHSDATQLADILKNLVADSGGDKSSQNIKTNIQADAALNALIIRADPTTMAELKDIISRLDVRRLQVLIEAVIVEVSENFSRDLGTELVVGDNSGSTIPLAATAPAGTLTSIIRAIATGDSTNVNLGTDPTIIGGKSSASGTSFAFLISALQETGEVNLLSTPSITTMDNEEAKIVVGQSVPFRTGSSATGSGGLINPFTTIERQDVGLTLQVTPHIHDGQLIRLEIYQEVSEVDDSDISIGTAGASDIITNKRTIETTVLVEDGDVIVLGGLIRDRTVKGTSGVPILMNIPILGYLFKRTTYTVEKQNLLVFLRPTVLGTSKSIAEQTKRKYTGIWEVEITGRDPLDAISDLFDGKH